MELYRGIQSVTSSFKFPVVTIGNFDGVHLGHRQIIQRAIDQARSRGGTAIAYTFRPHPQVALRPEANVPLLTTYDEKLELLAETGLDATIEEPFSREFSTIEPKDYFVEMLIKRLGAQAIVVGYDFAFGRGRAGNLAQLEELCKNAGVELTVVSPQRIGGEAVSSSKIRQHLMAGDVGAAQALLGREFFYRGVVIKGEGRGRKLGYPTANLKIENKLTLPYGVYATWASCGALFGVEGEHGTRSVPDRRSPTPYQEAVPSVTNVGVRPTFQSDRSGSAAPAGSVRDPSSSQELPVLVETHLLDRTVDLYGNVLQIRFVKRLREERRFPGVDALKAQIAVDAGSAREILAQSVF